MTFPDIEDNETPAQIVAIPKRFILDRVTDATGVSGTGVVATGVQFPDGQVAIAWNKPSTNGEPDPGSWRDELIRRVLSGEFKSSVAVWQSTDDMMFIHGHHGATVLRWVD